MFVDHLLLVVRDEDHHKVVKSGDDPPQLEPVHEKQGHRQALLQDLTQQGIL